MKSSFIKFVEILFFLVTCALDIASLIIGGTFILHYLFHISYTVSVIIWIAYLAASIPIIIFIEDIT